MQSVAERLIDTPLQRQFAMVSVAAVAVGFADGDWLTGLTLLSLWAIWAVVPAADGPPVLALALTFQWLQATSGVLYAAVSGRLVGAMYTPDYREMVLLSLGCVLTLAVGLRVGARTFLRGAPDVDAQSSVRLGWSLLGAGYVLPLALEPTLIEFAFQYPGIAQAILAMRFVRLGALYLILRRFVHASAWYLFLGVILLELGLSFSSFYAGFREPLIVAIAAVLERFHPRRMWHWASLLLMVCVGSLLGLVWLGVRGEFRPDFESDLMSQSREARTTRLLGLSTEFLKRDQAEVIEGMDALVDRMWPVNYPSMVLARVPHVIPHTDGALLEAAVQHVFMPRIVFPDKPVLPSDSDLVRRYAGVWVAGEEHGTSIAFGYVAESYVDFGVPMMFLPSLVWGWCLGLAFGWLATRIQTRELRVGLLMVIFWIALYLFERSWAKTMGSTGTLLIYFGLPCFILDRVLFQKAHQHLHEQLAETAVAHSTTVA